MATLQCIKIFENDWDVSTGKSVILYDWDALAQRIANRIALWKGEWYQDVTKGIDYLTLFNIQIYVERRLSVAIKKAILQDEYVTSVQSLTAKLDADGKVSVSYNIQSVFGTISGVA